MGEQIAVQVGSGSLHGKSRNYNQSSTIAPQKARWAGALDGADKALCADTINQINQWILYLRTPVPHLYDRHTWASVS